MPVNSGDVTEDRGPGPGVLPALAVLVAVLREADLVLEVGHLAFALVVQGEAAPVRGGGLELLCPEHIGGQQML